MLVGCSILHLHVPELPSRASHELQHHRQGVDLGQGDPRTARTARQVPFAVDVVVTCHHGGTLFPPFDAPVLVELELGLRPPARLPAISLDTGAQVIHDVRTVGMRGDARHPVRPLGRVGWGRHDAIVQGTPPSLDAPPTHHRRVIGPCAFDARRVQLSA